MNGSNDRYDHRGRRRVMIDREVYEQLTGQADAWRDLVAEIGTADRLVALLVEAPGVRALLMQEYAAWCGRKDAGETGAAVAAQVAGHSWGPSQAELVRRRQQPGAIAEEYRREHGGEYHGGPVTWTTGADVREVAA